MLGCTTGGGGNVGGAKMGTDPKWLGGGPNGGCARPGGSGQCCGGAVVGGLAADLSGDLAGELLLHDCKLLR